ncbi:MAG: inactive serine/threonine-protein kinase VRK3, partial [Chloroflexota bacterium]
MMHCQACATDNDDSARFCSQCAAPLRSTQTCPACGAENAAGGRFCNQCASALIPQAAQAQPLPASAPTSFANGRYQVARLLGEGGKKRVYLAHDTLLDRDVAFALIKTEGLDDAGRQRIRREARAMGRLGDHPHIVTVFDIGDEQHQPYLVSQLMTGGDLATRLAEAPEHRLPIDSAITIAHQVCQALAHAHSQHVIH